VGATYTTYEAKARLSEILRRVRAGQHVTISYRGEVVAEVRPLYETRDPARALKELEEQGVVAPPEAPSGDLAPLARRRGALRRFLAGRE
jgi:prevent-host-death family protein